MASKFGLQIGDCSRDSASIGLPRTHLLGAGEDPDTESVSLPVEFKPGFRFEKTNLLATVVEKWDEVTGRVVAAPGPAQIDVRVRRA